MTDRTEEEILLLREDERLQIQVSWKAFYRMFQLVFWLFLVALGGLIGLTIKLGAQVVVFLITPLPWLLLILVLWVSYYISLGRRPLVFDRRERRVRHGRGEIAAFDDIASVRLQAARGNFALLLTLKNGGSKLLMLLPGGEQAPSVATAIGAFVTIDDRSPVEVKLA